MRLVHKITVLVLLSAAVLFLAVAAIPDQASATVSVSAKTYGALGNGTHDDTANIQKAMTYVVSQGGGTVTLPTGTYVVSTLTVPGNVQLVGSGNTASWLKGRVTAAGNAAITDLKVGVSSRAFHLATGTNGARFTRVRFVGGGGMSAGYDQGVVRLDGHSAKNVTFSACVIERNSSNGNGVSIAETSNGHYENIVFTGCTFMGQPRMNIEVTERSGTGYRNINLLNNTFEASDSENISYDSAHNTAGYSTVSGNTVKGAGKSSSASWPYDFEINGCRSMTVTGNTMYSSRGAMLNINGVASTSVSPGYSGTISNNTFSSSSGVAHTTTSSWVMVGKTGTLISGNTFTLGTGGQVFYMHGAGNAIRSNTVTDSKAIPLVWLAAAPKTSVTGNTMTSPSGTITVASGSSGSTFSSNIFTTGRTQSSLFRITSGVSVTLSGNTCK